MTGHPWFPDTPAEKLAKLVVMRVAYEDRKGLPGAGTTCKTTMTREPVPPAMLTTEEQVGAAFGCGHFEVWAKDAANRFACGAPYVVQIPGPDGQVPKYVRQFEDEPEEELEAAMSPAEKLLRLELEVARKRMEEERSGFKVLFSEMRESHRADFDSLAKLMESINAANATRAPAAESGADGWTRKRLESLEDKLERERERTSELAVKAARKGGGEEPGDIWSLVLSGAPVLLEKWEERQKLERERLELEKARERRRREGASASGGGGGLVVAGVPLPSLEKLRGLIAQEGGVPEEPAAVFRSLMAQGMLPRAYEELLSPYLQAGHGNAEAAPS